MRTRMEKYYDNAEDQDNRLAKNQELYKEVTKSELDSFDVNSNMAILGDNPNSINIEQLRAMLDRKYRLEPKRKSISIDDNEEIIPVEIDETREYDINSIIKKAKENKDAIYEADRLKKLHNTQYDILKNLNITRKEPVTSHKDDEATLVDLINTITEKELSQTRELDPLDILTDLRGDDNTSVVTSPEISKEAIKKEITSEIKGELLAEVKKELTASNTFTQNDFEDFNDLKEDVESTKIIIKILIIIIIISFVAGSILLINKIFDLGLF